MQPKILKPFVGFRFFDEDQRLQSRNNLKMKLLEVLDWGDSGHGPGGFGT